MLKIFILLLLINTTLLAKTLPIIQFKNTQIFIEEMVKKHHFDKDELYSIFATIHLKIAEKPIIKPSKPSKKPSKPPMVWDKYQTLSITDQRIANGAKFWQQNLDALNRAQRKFSVPSEIIVAILGIETRYGDKKGTHPTLSVLAKRAFGNYRRRHFYRKELENFLLMSRENALQPLKIKGSYAGALGYPQFIPSSYQNYAVDFNRDNKIDLFSNPTDAIGSVANYLDRHQWHDGGQIARPIILADKQLKYATFATNKPKKNAAYWRRKGLNIDADIADKTKLAFIQLPQTQKTETWLTFWNFYVLTRYNHDNRYALAVYQLSKKIKQQFNTRKP